MSHAHTRTLTLEPSEVISANWRVHKKKPARRLGRKRNTAQEMVLSGRRSVKVKHSRRGSQQKVSVAGHNSLDLKPRPNTCSMRNISMNTLMYTISTTQLWLNLISRITNNSITNGTTTSIPDGISTSLSMLLCVIAFANQRS